MSALVSPRLHAYRAERTGGPAGRCR